MPPLSGPNNIRKTKIEVKGKTGTKSVQVNINGFAYKNYVVDLESSTYSEIQY